MNDVGLEEGSRRKLPPASWLLLFLAVAIGAGAASGAAVALLVGGSRSAQPAPVVSGKASLTEEGAVASATAAVLPAIVTIVNEQPARQDSQGNTLQTVSAGSGVIVDERGFIVTNEHVIHNQGKLKVVLNNGEERPATIVSDDAPFNDLAVLRIPSGGLKALPFGDSSALAPGQTLIAIGSPIYSDYFPYRNSVTVGVVSGLGRRWLREEVYEEDLIQTDAAVNYGNSGGPLLNLNGEVVGLLMDVVRTVNGSPVTGISFAISSKTMKPVVQAIVDKGKYPRPYFGIDHQDIDADVAVAAKLKIDHGALVQRVLDGGPAQKAGIRAGDVILRIGKADLSEDVPFINALATVGTADKVPVQVFRDGRTADVSVQLTAR